jgi:hypothetical protein
MKGGLCMFEFTLSPFWIEFLLSLEFFMLMGMAFMLVVMLVITLKRVSRTHRKILPTNRTFKNMRHV